MQDTTPPALSVPPDLTLEVAGGAALTPAHPAVAAWLAQASASDAADPAPRVTHDAASFPVDATTAVTFRAEDGAGLVTVGVARLTVALAEDLTLTITSPADGACVAGAVTVAWTVTGASAVQVAATRDGVDAGPGPTFGGDGDYVVTVTASRSGETLARTVRFTIDRVPPVVRLESPVARLRPEAEAPEDAYLVTVTRERGRLRLGGDLPIALRAAAHDDDGLLGGVVALTTTLDGAPVAAEASIEQALLCQLGAPLLGRHVVVVEAVDAAGNVGRATVAFDVVLALDEDALHVAGVPGRGPLTVTLTLPVLRDGDSCACAGADDEGGGPRPDDRLCSPDDPGGAADVALETLRLQALTTGRSAAPTRAQRAGHQRLVLTFDRGALAGPDGATGPIFRLVGRFFDAAGPAFVARGGAERGH
ncbi:MAG: hypothetical protein M9894_10460 [Planctomycetes bacterium]|nr:hypothetical protein [Planctomycetota bacterium]